MIDQSSFVLTLEQQFELRKIQAELADLDRDQAIERLLEAAKLLMLKDNMIRELLLRGLGV